MVTDAPTPHLNITLIFYYIIPPPLRIWATRESTLKKSTCIFTFLQLKYSIFKFKCSESGPDAPNVTLILKICLKNLVELSYKLQVYENIEIWYLSKSMMRDLQRCLGKYSKEKIYFCFGIRWQNFKNRDGAEMFVCKHLNQSWSVGWHLWRSAI